MAKKKDKGLKLRAKMTADDVDTLLVLLCRSKTVRSEARRFLKQEHFRADEMAKGVLAVVICNLHEHYPTDDVIPYLDLYTAVTEKFESIGHGMSDDQYNDILATPGKDGDAPGLLHHAYTVVKQSDFSIQGALKLLARFLVERGADEPLKRAIIMSGNSVVDNLGPMIAEREAYLAAIAAISEDTGATFETSSQKTDLALSVVPTKVPFFELFFDAGGMVTPAIYGLTAGTGYGKSTLMHQIAMSVARNESAVAELEGTPMRCVIAVSYEDDERKLYTRGMACASRIRKTVLESIANPETDLARVHTDYDVELAALENVTLESLPCEYDRFRKARKRLARNYTYYDRTKPGTGSGGVDEVCGLVDRHVERTGMRPALIVIDSIDLLTENWLIAEVGAFDVQKQVPGMIPMLVHQLRRRLAVAYGCTVLITNQLSGANLKKESMALLDHSDAGGSKSWAKPLDGHFLLGKPTADMVSQLVMTKDRHGSHLNQRQLIFLDGAFGRWLDASGTHVVHNKAIVRKSIVQSIHAETMVKQPKTTPHTSADMLDAEDFKLK